MDNAANRKLIRAKEKQAAIDARQRADVVRELMSTRQGREWVWNKLSECQLFSTTFTGDPHTSAFNEGRRATGLSILDDIMIACPQQYILAMQESHERSTLTEQRSRAIDDGGDSGREGYPSDSSGGGGSSESGERENGDGTYTTDHDDTGSNFVDYGPEAR